MRAYLIMLYSMVFFGAGAAYTLHGSRAQASTGDEVAQLRRIANALERIEGRCK